MSRRRLAALPFACAAVLCCVPGPLAADEGPTAEKPASADKANGKPEKEPPATVVAEKGPFVIWVDAAGSLEPLAPVEVKVEMEAYAGELEIVEVVPPGPVKKGDVLVRFDPEKLDEQAGIAEKDAAIAREALSRQEEEAKRAEEGARLALERAVTEKSRADEALDHFTKVDRELRTKEAEHRLQGSRDNIQDQEEELDQLRKMYKADDLVEGTEEIVLKRSERQLGRSKAWLGYQIQRNKALLEIELPRELESLQQEARKESLELDRLQATQPPALAQGRLELEKARMAAERGAKNLAKLRGDRERLVVPAPADGFAVPGGFAKGKWAGVEDAARALRPGEVVRSKQVLFTIVRPGAVTVRTTVPEAALLQVREGQPAEVTLGVQPDKKVEARVTRVARVSSDGNFEVILEPTTQDERWMPGYAAKAKIRVSEKADAVTVPAASLGADGEKKQVHVWADGKATPREVTVGATSNGRVEIVKGLEAGERVLKSPPKPQ